MQSALLRSLSFCDFLAVFTLFPGVRGYAGSDHCAWLTHTQYALPGEDPMHTPHLPPESCGTSLFWRQLRPEFVKAYPVPLSADAGKGMTIGCSDKHEHDLKVRDATYILCQKVIPAFANSLVEIVVKRLASVEEHSFPHHVDGNSPSPASNLKSSPGDDMNRILGSVTQPNVSVLQQLMEGVDVSVEVHQAGISLRHLGAIRSAFWRVLPRPCKVVFRSSVVTFEVGGTVPRQGDHDQDEPQLQNNLNEKVEEGAVEANEFDSPREMPAPSLPNPWYDPALDVTFELTVATAS
jgi:hypothetical protein